MGEDSEGRETRGRSRDEGDREDIERTWSRGTMGNSGQDRADLEGTWFRGRMGEAGSRGVRERMDYFARTKAKRRVHKLNAAAKLLG